MTRLMLLLAVTLGLATPASAFEGVCEFTAECFEAEACDEAAFALHLRPAAEDGRVRLGSIADEVTGTVSEATSGATVIRAEGPSSFQLLTILDSAARYTLHLTDGPAVVTYHGTCEAE